MWDRVPIEAPPPARDDGLADPDDGPHIVHSNYVQFLYEPPSACVLHPPMVNLNVRQGSMSGRWRYGELSGDWEDRGKGGGLWRLFHLPKISSVHVGVVTSFFTSIPL